MKTSGWSHQTGHSDPAVSEVMTSYVNRTKKLDDELNKSVTKFAKINETNDLNSCEIEMMMKSNGGFEWTLDNILYEITNIANKNMKLYFE